MISSRVAATRSPPGSGSSSASSCGSGLADVIARNVRGTERCIGVDRHTPMVQGHPDAGVDLRQAVQIVDLALQVGVLGLLQIVLEADDLEARGPPGAQLDLLDLELAAAEL